MSVSCVNVNYVMRWRRISVTIFICRFVRLFQILIPLLCCLSLWY